MKKLIIPVALLAVRLAAQQVSCDPNGGLICTPIATGTSLSLAVPFNSGQQQGQTAYVGVTNPVGPLILSNILAPTAPTAAAGAAGSLTGTYIYSVQFCIAAGNYLSSYCTEAGATASVALSSQVGSLTSIPLAPQPGVARILLRTIAGGTALKLLTKLTDNTTTTYTDSIADGSLGASPDFLNRTAGMFLATTGTPAPIAVGGPTSSAVGYNAVAQCSGCIQVGRLTDAAWAGTSYNLPLAAPTSPAATSSGASGSCTAGTFYYKIATADAIGGSSPGPEVTATTPSGSTGSVLLSWANVTGQDFTIIYKGTAPGAENVLVNVFGGVTSFRDTCVNITTAGFPPAFPTGRVTALLNNAASPFANGAYFGPGKQLQISALGVLTKENNETTAGIGNPYILFSANRTDTTTPSAITLLTGLTGMFAVNVRTDALGTICSNTVTLGFTSAFGAETPTIISTTTTVGQASSYLVDIASGNLTLTPTIALTCTGSGFKTFIQVERKQ